MNPRQWSLAKQSNFKVEMVNRKYQILNGEYYIKNKRDVYSD